MKRLLFAAAIVMMLSLSALGAGSDFDKRVEHGYADSNGVKIHYARLGPKKGDKSKAPLIIMIHGFPDFWYTWRDQMEALSDNYQLVAIDQRGYNLSDKPKGVENYDIKFLVGDVVAVIKHLGRDKAVVVGHDWGGMVAADGRQADYPEPSTSARDRARACYQSRAAEEQPVRPQLSKGGCCIEVEGRATGVLGQGSASKREVYRGVQTL
jgi:hypothetical protein